MSHTGDRTAGALQQVLGGEPGRLQRCSRVRDAVALLEEERVVSACDQALLSLPPFATLYAGRARLPEAFESPPGAPAGTLARVHRDFLAWYGLQPGFFPAPPGGHEAMRPTAFAAYLLGWAHDGLHVLTAYETADVEEVSLQSFLFAQVPVVFAWFIRDLLVSPALADTLRYKHLHDVLDSPWDDEALERGRAAEPLLAFPFMDHWLEPLEALRLRLRVPPRVGRSPQGRFRNTCGGRDMAPFFQPLPPS